MSGRGVDEILASKNAFTRRAVARVDGCAHFPRRRATLCGGTRACGVWRGTAGYFSWQTCASISCGTSLGPAPMKPGAKIEITIEGIGTLANVMG